MSNNTKRISVNFLYQLSYQMLSIIIPFITSPYVARVIGAEGLGIYSFYNSIAYYFVLFGMLGLLNYGNRAIAKARNNQSILNKEFSAILYLHLFVASLSFIAFFCFCFTTADIKYALLQLPFVASAIFDISWFYFGLEQFKRITFQNGILKIIACISIFTFVNNKSDLSHKE